MTSAMVSAVDLPVTRASLVANLHLAFLLAGASLHGMAYDSLAAMAIGPLLLLLGAFPVAAWGLGTRAPGLMLSGYARVFCVCWFVAGVAAGYAAWLDDPFQLGSDAFGFFQLASDPNAGLGAAELRELTDGFGAVVLWRWVYDIAEAADIGRQRFVGIGFNTLVVAATAAPALHACRLVYGPDARREARLVLALSGCGLLWIFAAIHLRDAIIFFTASLLTVAWLHYLRRGGWLAALVLLVWLTAITGAFGVLRTEFVVVPLVASGIGLAAIVLAPAVTSGGARRAVAWLLLLSGAVVAVLYALPLLESLDDRAGTYREFVRNEASASSLGAQLVVNQPPLVRVFVGSAYLLLFPIPVWAGLIGDSALHAFKALNALFFYALLPLVLLAIHDLVRQRKLRTPQTLFVLGLSAVMLAVISLTSLESRHFGAFLLPVFLLALASDPSAPGHGARYGRALGGMLAAMTVLHLAWGAAKFG